MYDEFRDKNWIPKSYFSHWSENIDKDLKDAKLPVKELYSRNELNAFYRWSRKDNSVNEKGTDIRSMALQIFILSLPVSNNANNIQL